MTNSIRLVLVGSLTIHGSFGAPRLLAQTTASENKKVTFEVASVKPNKSNNGQRDFRLLPGGRVTVTGLLLRDLIWMAYGGEAIQTPGQIVGGPSWLDSDRFDVLAKGEGDLAPLAEGWPARLITMMRSLLEERFKVRVHTETRDVPTYALILSNKDSSLGPQLHVSSVECPEFTPGSPPAPPDQNRWCGIRGSGGKFMAQGVTMAQLAQSYANAPLVGRPVKDHTGLAGRYDMSIEFVPAFLNGRPNPAADSGPSLFTALPEQLGLRLQAETGPVEIVVIDRAEHPTED